MSPRVPTARQSLFIGGIGFGLVGVAAFAVWAFAGGALTRAVGEGGFYAVCAAVFIGLAGLVFGQLVIGPGGMTRMYALFTPAFLAYATLWCAAWFALAGRKGWLGGELKAELLGAALGAAAMAAVMVWGFGARREFGRATLTLFAGNALGYFLGKVAWQWLRGGGCAGVRRSAYARATRLAGDARVGIALRPVLWGGHRPRDLPVPRSGA